MTRKFDSYDDYKRHLKNKYGVGEGINYKPWLTIRDVKGKNAFRSIVKGITTGRKHHFLSSIETQLFYILEFNKNTIDIREQFPLFPLHTTKKIAQSLGVNHPQVPTSEIDHVMTTDILLTCKKKNNVMKKAFCVKPLELLADKRTLQKIEIERVWWQENNVDFFIFTGNKQTEILSRNISWATDPIRSNTQHNLNSLLEPATLQLSTGKYLKADICDEFMGIFNISKEEALNLLRSLIGSKLIKVDMGVLLEDSISLNINYVESIDRAASNAY